MKKNKIKSIVFLSGILFILSSCAMDYLTMNVTEPAPVTISKDIKKIGIINRSKPSEKTAAKLDEIDKILSAEGKNFDRDGANAAIKGLKDELLRNQRFSEIKILDSLWVENPGMGIFPAPLAWDDLEKLCKINNVDAIFSLAFYDTDTKINYNTSQTEINGPLGTKIPAIEHHASVVTLIKTGWRIYDPAQKVMADEFVVFDETVSQGKGINPLKAISAIMGRKDLVMQASNNIGYNYAQRILPFRVRVTREYYVNGTDNFKTAKRRAQTGDWDGAAELWYKELDNPKSKIAGRACYNAAIINEINGDLTKAVDWASKSYTDYKNKKALYYMNILKDRIYRNEQLKRQTE